jgi:hypothetical protein
MTGNIVSFPLAVSEIAAFYYFFSEILAPFGKVTCFSYQSIRTRKEDNGGKL